MLSKSTWKKKEATRRLGVKYQFDLAGRVAPTMV
jgi:hypothetical protein